ncbi:MAG TPA: hypothetical protein VFE62_09700 [Gemmataceae bacterium]|nr:hypothetical protein [Gemmataceae bacterium]
MNARFIVNVRCHVQNKVCYENRGEARRSRKRVRQCLGKEMQIYECVHCHYFHLATKNGGNASIRESHS